MNNLAFVLTIEAILALLVVAAIAAFPAQTEKTDLFELLLLQKENDLLKIWLEEETLDENTLASDFKFVFPQLNGAIEFEGKKIEIGKQYSEAKNSVSSSALFLEKDSRLSELRITAYN